MKTHFNIVWESFTMYIGQWPFHLFAILNDIIFFIGIIIHVYIDKDMCFNATEMI